MVFIKNKKKSKGALYVWKEALSNIAYIMGVFFWVNWVKIKRMDVLKKNVYCLCDKNVDRIK